MKRLLNISERKKVLAVGQFLHRKGLDVLIKVIPKIQKDICIYIIGGKVTEEYKSSLTDDEMARVHFLILCRKMSLQGIIKRQMYLFCRRERMSGD